MWLRQLWRCKWLAVALATAFSDVITGLPIFTYLVNIDSSVITARKQKVIFELGWLKFIKLTAIKMLLDEDPATVRTRLLCLTSITDLLSAHSSHNREL